MTKMLQGVSCHPLTPTFDKTHCNLHQVGKKKKEKKNQTIKWHLFFIHSSSRYLKIMLTLSGTSHGTSHVNTSSLSLLLSSVKRIQAQACETFLFTRSQLVKRLKLLPVGKKSCDPVCLLSWISLYSDHPVRSQALTNSLTCVLIGM